MEKVTFMARIRYILLQKMLVTTPSKFPKSIETPVYVYFYTDLILFNFVATKGRKCFYLTSVTTVST